MKIKTIKNLYTLARVAHVAKRIEVNPRFKVLPISLQYFIKKHLEYILQDPKDINKADALAFNATMKVFNEIDPVILYASIVECLLRERPDTFTEKRIFILARAVACILFIKPKIKK